MEMNELNLLSEYQLMSFIHLWKWTLFVVILHFLAVVQPFDFIEFSGRQAGKPLEMLVPFFGIFGTGAGFINGRFSVFYQ